MDDIILIGLIGSDGCCVAACEHAACFSEPLQGVQQQQHGTVRSPQHDANRRESF